MWRSCRRVCGDHKDDEASRRDPFSRVKKVEQCASFEAAQEDADLAGKNLEDWVAPAAKVCCQEKNDEDFTTIVGVRYFGTGGVVQVNK